MIIDLYSDKASIHDDKKERVLGDTDIRIDYALDMLENSKGHDIYVNRGAVLTLEQYRKLNIQHNLVFTHAFDMISDELKLTIEDEKIYCTNINSRCIGYSKVINTYVKDIIAIKHSSHSKMDIRVDLDSLGGDNYCNISIACEIDTNISINDIEFEEYKTENFKRVTSSMLELFNRGEYIYQLDRQYIRTYKFKHYGLSV